MKSFCRVVVPVTLLLSAAVAPLAADVEITWRRVGNDVRAGEPQRLVEWVDGERQREDHAAPGRPPHFTTIRDLKALRDVRLWHRFKFMIVQSLAPREERTVAPDVEPRRTGATEKILDRICHEYTFSATSAEKVFTLKGSFWVAEDGPGGDEYRRFYEGLSKLRAVPAGGRDEEESGEGREGRRPPNRGPLVARFIAASRAHGIPYRIEYEVTGRGTPLRVRQEAERISTRSIPASTFVPPAGYQVRR